MTGFKSAVLQRYEKAKAARTAFDTLLADCYAVALPGIDPRLAADVSQNQGAKTDQTQYDDQASRSLHKRKLRVVGGMYPLGEPVLEFAFEDDRARALEGEQKTAATRYLKGIEEAVQAAIERSNFYLALPPALADALISTGCLMVDRGSRARPLRFQAVPVSELVPEEGPWGTLETVFRARKVKRRFVASLWPEARLPADWAKKEAKDPEELVEIVEAQIHVPVTGAQPERWDYSVHLTEGEHELFKTEWKAKRLIAFRFDKQTGEVMGRGPVTRCRASALTANKTVELVLKNASIAVTGIWQADDDGVLNPANIKLVPGAIIPKAQGSKGLQPLEAPGRFDVSTLVLNDLRQSIKEHIEGPSLPPLAGDRRTAYEFAVRERELAEVEIPEHQRLFWELDEPLGLAALDILSDAYFTGSRFFVDQAFRSGDQLSLLPRPSNPITRLREQSEIMRAQEGLLAAAAMDPETTARLVNREAFLRRFLRAKGLTDGELRSPAELKAEAAQAQQAAALEGQAAAVVSGVQAGAGAQSALAGGDVAGAVEAMAMLGDLGGKAA